jgi:hypothetical protein
VWWGLLLKQAGAIITPGRQLAAQWTTNSFTSSKAVVILGRGTDFAVVTDVVWRTKQQQQQQQPPAHLFANSS